MPIDPTLGALLGTVKAAGEGLASLQKLVGAGEAKAKTAELYTLILGAQTQTLEAQVKHRSMLDEIEQLERQMAALKAWDQERPRYALAEAGKGVFVYALRKANAGDEPPHWICAHCYQDGRKSLLQSRPTNEKGYGNVCLLFCPSCDFETMLNRFHPEIVYIE